MNIGIILNTNDPETSWNCFRFGNEALAKNHAVKIFLLGKGVEVENEDVHGGGVRVYLSMKGDFFMSKFVACFNRLTQLLVSLLRLKF